MKSAQGPDTSASVVENREILPGVFSMVLRTGGEVFTDSAPGQFVQVEPSPGPFPVTRRPLTIDGVPGRDLLRLVYGRVGPGTSALASLDEGAMLRVLGPLGTGYRLLRGRWLLVGGGLGAAGFGFLASKVESARILVGAASSEGLLPLPGLQVEYATEDGSRGRKGLVTALLADADIENAVNIAVCGPVAMMKAVVAMLPEALHHRVQVSTEARMGCGYGVCEGCSVPSSAGGYLRCCTDGPVLTADSIDWGRWTGVVV